MNKEVIKQLCQNVPEILKDIEKWGTKKEYINNAKAIAKALNSNEGLNAEIFNDKRCTHFALLALSNGDITLEQFTSVSLYWSGQKDYHGKYYDIDYYTLPTTNEKTTNASHKFRQFLPLLTMMGLYEIPMSDEDFDQVITALADANIPESERRFTVMYFDDPRDIADILHTIPGLGFGLFMPRATENGYELIIPSFTMVQTVLNVLKPGEINLDPKVGPLSAEDVHQQHVEGSHPFGTSILGHENFEADNVRSLRLGFALHDIYHAVLLAHVPVRKAIHHITKLAQEFSKENNLSEDDVMSQSLGFLIDQEFAQYFRLAIFKKLGIDVSMTSLKKYINPETCFILCLTRLLFPKITPNDLNSLDANNIQPLQDDFLAHILADIMNNSKKWKDKYGIDSKKLVHELRKPINPSNLVNEVLPGFEELLSELGNSNNIFTLQNKIYEHLENTTHDLLYAANDKEHEYHKLLTEAGRAFCRDFEDNSNNDTEESEEDNKEAKGHYKAFVEAILKGNIKTVKTHLKNEAFDINAVLPSSEMIPQVLIENLLDKIEPQHWEDEGFIQCFKAIVGAGLDFKLHCTGSVDITTTWGALQKENIGMPVEFRKFCIENGAPINSLSEDECEAEVHYAIRHSDADYLRFLCEHGADINVRNSDGKTVRDLYDTIGIENYKAIKHILKEYGAERSERKKQKPEKPKTLKVTTYSPQQMLVRQGHFAEPKREVKESKKEPSQDVSSFIMILKKEAEEKKKRLANGKKLQAILDDYAKVVESSNGLDALINEIINIFSMEPAALFSKINELDLSTKIDLGALPIFLNILSSVRNKSEEDMQSYVQEEIEQLRKEQEDMQSDETTQSVFKKLNNYYDPLSIKCCYSSLIRKLEDLQEQLNESDDKRALIDKISSKELEQFPELYQKFFESISSSLQANEDAQKITEVGMKLMMLMMDDDGYDLEDKNRIAEIWAHLMLVSAKNMIFKILNHAKKGAFSFKRFMTFFLELGVDEEDALERTKEKADELASKIDSFMIKMYTMAFQGSITLIYGTAQENFFSTFLNHYHNEDDREFLEASVQVLLDMFDEDEIAEAAQEYINNDGEYASFLNTF